MAGQGGRLEVVLDRSWETQSVTWAGGAHLTPDDTPGATCPPGAPAHLPGLTWWDPLPCGQELLGQVRPTPT